MNEIRQINLLDKGTKNYIPQILMVFFLVLNLLSIVVENLLEISGTTINRIIIYYSMFFPVALYFNEFLNKKPFSKSFILTTILILYQIIITIIGTVYANNISKSTLLGRYFLSITFTISIYSIRHVNISKEMINFMFSLNILFTLFCIMLLFSDKAYTFNGTNWLTLNYSNPNYTALLLLGNYGILLLSLSFYKSNFTKLILIALSLFVLYMIYLTHSRTSMLIALVLLFFSMSNFKLNKKSIFIVILIPLIFFILYNSLYSIEGLHDVTIMGKPIFSGRNELWRVKLHEFYHSPVNIFFGNFAVSQLENAHNGLLTIIVNYGVVGAILYFSNMYVQLKKYVEKTNSCKPLNNSMLVILSLILTTVSEASLVILGGMFCVFELIALSYAKYSIDNNNYNQMQFVQIEDSKCW